MATDPCFSMPLLDIQQWRNDKKWGDGEMGNDCIGNDNVSRFKTILIMFMHVVVFSKHLDCIVWVFYAILNYISCT